MQQQRSYEVDWRFISLWILNEDQQGEWYTPAYRAGHYLGHKGLRIANAIRLQEDGEAVGAWYTALGEALHVNNRRDEARADNEAFLEAVLDDAGFSAAYLSDADDDSHDEYIRAETEMALSRLRAKLQPQIVGRIRNKLTRDSVNAEKGVGPGYCSRRETVSLPNLQRTFPRAVPCT